jgi:capping protein alpha
LDIASGKISGILKCRVHYYEDGNVQLDTSKDLEDNISVSGSVSV